MKAAVFIEVVLLLATKKTYNLRPAGVPIMLRRASPVDTPTTKSRSETPKIAR
jgi:hypothetical protein